MKKIEKEKKPAQQILVPSYILYAGKILNAVSPFFTTRFAARLFLTPFRYKLPTREEEMDRDSYQERVTIPSIRREIVVYHYGEGHRKILLVHGWSGRGTQLSVIAKALKNQGFGIVSFDAPGHGKAPGKISMMPFFTQAALHLESLYGPFDAVIGHSLGGMASLRAVKEGMNPKRMVIIGTGNSVTHITQEFVRNLHLSAGIARRMKEYLDNKFQQDLEELSGAVSAGAVKVPTLVIHDEDDIDVPVNAAHEIASSLENAEILITEGLGHRRILGNRDVIKRIVNFLTV